MAGVWTVEAETLAIGLFEETGEVASHLLDAEAAFVGAFLGRELRVSLRLR